jgi:hypothetical protein
MLTFLLHLSSTVMVRFARSLVFCKMVRSSLYVFLLCFFPVCHCTVCPSSMHVYSIHFLKYITYNIQEYNIHYNNAVTA